MTTIDRITDALRSHRFRFASEAELQEGIERVLLDAAIPLEREFRLGRDRVDFWVEGIALEVKVDGSLSEVTRQLHRYAQAPQVRAVLLVTTRALHRRVPAEMTSKPIAVFYLEGSVL